MCNDDDVEILVVELVGFVSVCVVMAIVQVVCLLEEYC